MVFGEALVDSIEQPPELGRSEHQVQIDFASHAPSMSACGTTSTTTKVTVSVPSVQHRVDGGARQLWPDEAE